MEPDKQDIFVHYEDLLKASVTKEMLREIKSGKHINLEFSCMSYIGKYNKSKKAVEIKIVDIINKKQ